MYSTAVDMWSVGCIFAEVLTGDYFFEGTSELDQLHKIFALLGVPNKARWPGYEDLPQSKMFKWKGLPERSKLRDRSTHLWLFFKIFISMLFQF